MYSQTQKTPRRHRKGKSAPPNVTTGVLARRDPQTETNCRCLVTRKSLLIPKTLNTPSPGGFSLGERANPQAEKMRTNGRTPAAQAVLWLGESVAGHAGVQLLSHHLDFEMSSLHGKNKVKS